MTTSVPPLHSIKFFYAAFMIGVLLLLLAVNLFTTNPFSYTFDTALRFMRTIQYEREFRAFSAQTATTQASASSASTTTAVSLPVLVYHGILSSSDGESVNTTRELFKQHLFTLKRAGYQTVSLEDLYAFKRGVRALPQKPIVITFDDGRTDTYEEVDPLLKALNYQATMFVITKYSLDTIKNHYYLNRDELARMEASGRWDIQPHTHAGHGDIATGPDTNDTGPFYAYRMWLPQERQVETYVQYRKRITEDMQTARSLVANKINSHIIGFAFPFGDYGQNETQDPVLSRILVEEASKLFPLLFYQQVPGDFFKQTYAPASESSRDSFLVRRISIGGNIDAKQLMNIIEGSTAKPLPYHDTIFASKDWILVWGDAEPIPDGGVNLRASEGLTGASMILDGTRMWKDYVVTTQVTLSSPAGVFVWARYVNDDNNAGCNFTPTFVHAEQTVAGQHRVIKGVNKPVVPQGPVTVAVAVRDRTITCMVNGIPHVQSEFLDPSLSEGGVGLKTWYQDPSVANILIHSVDVALYGENAAGL